MKLYVSYKLEPPPPDEEAERDIVNAVVGIAEPMAAFAPADPETIMVRYDGSAFSVADAHAEVLADIESRGHRVSVDPADVEELPRDLAQAAARDAVTVLEGMIERGRTVSRGVNLQDLHQRLVAVRGEESEES